MNSIERTLATYEFKQLDHLVRKEFETEIHGPMGCQQALFKEWQARQGMPAHSDVQELFLYDPQAHHLLQTGAVGFGISYSPSFAQLVIEKQGEYEIVQDGIGRVVRRFRGEHAHPFMPQFLKAPVTCRNDWEENVRPRLDPNTPVRWSSFERGIAEAQKAAGKGQLILLGFTGGYMYLRDLLGTMGLLYAFHDLPDLIHDMMRQWALLYDTVLERVQARIELDELWVGDDSCYKNGLLISPAMFREFLLPYYQEVFGKARQRQKRRIYIDVDSDGYVVPAIPLYMEAGVDIMCPFEVAAGCDVVEIGKQFPNLIIMGGIDKRVLAAGRQAIDAYLSRIMPAMNERGGFIPTCDHHVPFDVSFADYLYYRRRICELDHA
jgi:hypothetical protein